MSGLGASEVLPACPPTHTYSKHANTYRNGFRSPLVHRPYSPPSCCLSPAPPVPNGSGVLTALLPFFILLHSLPLLLCWWLSRVGRVTNKGGVKGWGLKFQSFLSTTVSCSIDLLNDILAITCFHWSCKIDLKIWDSGILKKKEHGNGRWQIGTCE